MWMRKRITVRGQLGGDWNLKLQDTPAVFMSLQRREKKYPFPFQGEQRVFFFSGCAAF